MEFRKAQFAKKSYRYQRNDGNQKDEQDSRSGGSRYNRDSRSGGSRFNRNDNGSRFNRGSEDNRRGEMHKATCGDCGNECQIPFKPKYDRPVYCKECFQNHKPQEHSGGSRYNRDSRSGGSRFNRNDNGSRFNRGSEDNRRGEMHKATCGDCGNECQIPFKPKYDRPVYCKECFQNHKPQERSGGSRFSRGSSYGRGASYGRNYRSSGYNQGQTRFQRDRTPINSRDNFRTTKYPPNRDESYRKNSRDNNSISFYSTLRKKLFAILGEKKCVNCGFDDERALGFSPTDDVTSFDYIQRAGAASSWEKYISDPDLAKKKLQIICLNCNQIKQKEFND